MEKIRLTASEEMSFENVDGRTNGSRMPVYTIISPLSVGSGELKTLYPLYTLYTGGINIETRDAILYIRLCFCFFTYGTKKNSHDI